MICQKFASKSDYRPCENGHAFTVTDRCTYCGYETTRTETEEHTIRTDAKAIDDHTHLESCELCSYTGVAAHSFTDNKPEDNHRCKFCGLTKDHLYEINYCYITDSTHEIMYYCRACRHVEYTEKEPHSFDEIGRCICGYHK